MEMVISDPARLASLQTNTLPELQKLATEAIQETPAYVGDKWLYRMAIIALSLLGLIAALGSILLVVLDRTTPEVLVALGSAAVGALVGLFAPAPTSK